MRTVLKWTSCHPCQLERRRRAETLEKRKKGKKAGNGITLLIVDTERGKNEKRKKVDIFIEFLRLSFLFRFFFCCV
jgi:hypothetical protein